MEITTHVVLAVDDTYDYKINWHEQLSTSPANCCEPVRTGIVDMRVASELGIRC